MEKRYRCWDCNAIFKQEMAERSESNWPSCPICGSTELHEVFQCTDCGNWDTEEYIWNGLCPDCNFEKTYTFERGCEYLKQKGLMHGPFENALEEFLLKGWEHVWHLWDMRYRLDSTFLKARESLIQSLIMLAKESEDWQKELQQQCKNMDEDADWVEFLKDREVKKESA